MQERKKKMQAVRQKKGKWIKQLAAIALTICMSAGVMPTGFEVWKPLEAEATVGGVEQKIGELKKRYPTDSYFSADGGPCTSHLNNQGATCNNCKLSNIMNAQHGGWPGGTDGWTCCGFARFIFYQLFGVMCSNTSGGWSNVSISQARIGDYVVINGGTHYGIYLWSNGDSFYMYESNVKTPNRVAYATVAYPKSRATEVRRANNYDAVNAIPATGTVTGVYTDDVINITKNNARIRGHVTTNGQIDPGQMVVYFGINEYQDNNARYGDDYRLYGNGNIGLYWDLDSVGITLKEGTRYWYQIYAGQDGRYYSGGWKSFVTAIDFTPQNLGNSFYAYIKSKDSNMYVSNPSMSSDSATSAQLKQKATGGTNNELWKFSRMSNGVYQVQSVFDGRFMCSWNGGVYAGYAQHYWYIQKDMGGYRLRQFEYAASGLGVSSKTEGAAISFCDVKPSVSSQIFDIQIVSPENVNFRPSGTTIYNNHVYEMYDSSVTWAQADAIAKKKGGHLVTITSAAEMNEMKTFLSNSQYKNSSDAIWWMGYTDAEKEGTWKWTTGETSSYKNWRSGQPDNAGGIEDYAGLWGGNDFTWNDAPGENGYGFIVEYDNLEKVAPVQTMKYNGHLYELYDIPVNGATASYFAQQKGGYLATITSSQEQAQITAMAKKSGLYKSDYYGWYIGLERDTTTKAFKWMSTNETLNYKNWAAGEPNNANNNENRAILKAENASNWNDVPIRSYVGFIVEYNYETHPVLTVPTVTTNKEWYNVGEMANIVWTKSAANLNFYQYWLTVTNYDTNTPVYAGPADSTYNANKNSYNVQLPTKGKYAITVYAIPSKASGIVQQMSKKYVYVGEQMPCTATVGEITILEKTTNSITAKATASNGGIVEYSVDQKNWFTGIITGLTENTTYTVYARVKATDTTQAGAISSLENVKTAEAAPKYRLGDADGDGEITVSDALAILRYVANIEQTVFVKEAADCDKDGGVTMADAVAVLKHMAKIIILEN